MYSQLVSYYMDKKKKQVHEDYCTRLKGFTNKIYLGNFLQTTEALEEGRKIFSGATACDICTTE